MNGVHVVRLPDWTDPHVLIKGGGVDLTGRCLVSESDDQEV